jgi:prophage regulatory protein
MRGGSVKQAPSTPQTLKGYIMNRLLTAHEVLKVTGYRSRTTLWRKVKDDHFPAPIKLGGTSIRWNSAEVEAWIQNEPRQTYQH